MNSKKLLKALLFPHAAVMAVLLPVSAIFLIYAMMYLDSSSPMRIASYLTAFYTLCVYCARMPRMIRRFKDLKSKNRYLSAWTGDARLRMNVIVTCNVLWNGAYALLQLGLGIRHGSAWFYSLAAYYASLAVMRFFLVRHTARHIPGEKMRQELIHYRTCGAVFLFMNIALSGMMLFMIRDGRMTRHHEITTIAMAAYTFTALTVAIVNVVRYRRYQSPAMSASKAISLATACVSMLTLESTMLVTFGDGSMTPETIRLFMALSGGAVSAFIIVMAIYMIVQSNKRLHSLEADK